MVRPAIREDADVQSTDPPLPRDQFRVVEHRLSLDHAAVGPLPRVAVDAMAAVAGDFARLGSDAFEVWEELPDRARSTAAQVLGVPSDDVAFVKNTTEGLSFVASGLTWAPGDRVLVPDREFPSTLYPWLALRDLGVVVDLIEPRGEDWSLPIDAFVERLDERPTRLVCTSWVQFGRGWRTDLAELADACHERGALLVVDIIQGAGVVPCELAAWGVDAAAADGHKWLLGPEGLGVLYVAPPLRDELRVLEPGWASVPWRMEWDNLDFALDPTARRFEGGTPNTAGMAALEASMQLLLDAGIDAIAAHVAGLLDLAATGLVELGAEVRRAAQPSGRAGILSFAVPGLPAEEAAESLRSKGVLCSPRAGGVRISPHGYSTAEDIDRLVSLVAALRPAGGS